MDDNEKRLKIYTTGGTIGGQSSDPNAKVDESSNLILQDINDIQRQYNGNCKIDIEELYNIDSAEVTPKHWSIISNKIQQDYDNYDNFIILHGTNTMSRTAFALTCALPNIEKPIILTGSQLARSAPNTDAKQNLDNAIHFAMKNSQIIGSVIVFGENIVSGNNSIKIDNKARNAFVPFAQNEVLGKINDGDIEYNENAISEHNNSFGKFSSNKLLNCSKFNTSRHITLTDSTGLNPDIVLFLLQSGKVDSLTLRCSGDGDPNMQLLSNAFWYMKNNNIPVVLVGESTNSITTETGLNDPGALARSKFNAIPAGNLPEHAATIKLQWLLGLGVKYKDLNEAMKKSPYDIVNEYIYENASKSYKDTNYVRE